MPDTATLILLRHGESEWNRRNLFTGWVDVDLTDRGREEAVQAGRDLAAAGLAPGIVHTSLQRRAIRTAWVTLDEIDRMWLPVRRSWRLNERHYGALQGLDKRETAERHGADQVHAWRRSYDVRPPELDPADERSGIDERYQGLPADLLPRAEGLADVVDRMLPWWYDAIVPDLRAGLTPLVAAHGNSLRALVKHLDAIGDDSIPALNIPTGIPLVYELDDAMRPVGDPDETGVRGRYLGDPEAARAAVEAVARQAT